MPFIDWFRPPRRLLLFYLAGTLAAATALAWLGWRLIDQEQALEVKRAQDRLEIAADRVAAALQHSLDELERHLWTPGGTLPEDTLVLEADRHSVRARPPERLLFYPVTARGEEPPAGIFRAGEAVEFSGGGPVKATVIYRELARSQVAPVRAGALMRLGRSLRRAGQLDEALRTYDDLALLGAAPVEGLPAELVAREARCTVLERLGRNELLGREARELYGHLVSGHWQLPHAAWDFLMEETRSWLGSGLTPPPGLDSAIALSAAAESLWKRRPDLPPAGQALSWHGDRPVIALWKATPERLAAVLAGSDFLAATSRQAGSEAQVQIRLADRDGRALLGQLSGLQAMRTAAATRLPWDLSVSAANPAGETAEAGARRRMLLAGLALIGALILGSGYFTFRGIQRELAVGRLQSEFVSAVSHEFRTPLTSLRQLSEMLYQGRVIHEERRQQYYEVLARESQRLHRLVEGLLNFGRAEAGSARQRVEPLAPAELVRATVEEFRRQAGHCRVEMLLEEAPCTIRGEREMLSLALWNLLDNAAKYSGESPEIDVTLKCADGWVSIAVRDRGIGIPPAEQKHVFQKFVRGAAAKTQEIKGTGIGLALVQQVVRAHGGQVRLASEVGRGSTFTMILPAKD